MTKVNINSTTHQVEVDCPNDDLGYVIEKAQRLFDETKPPDRTGPAYGFQAQVSPQQGYDRAILPYGEQMPVRATETM